MATLLLSPMTRFQPYPKYPFTSILTLLTTRMPSCLFRNMLFLLPHQAVPQFHSRAPSLNVWPFLWLHPSFLLIFFLSLDTDDSKYPPPALIFPDLKSSSWVSHQPLKLNIIKRELSMVTIAASHLRTSPSIPPSLSRGPQHRLPN